MSTEHFGIPVENVNVDKKSLSDLNQEAAIRRVFGVEENQLPLTLEPPENDRRVSHSF